MTVTDLIDYNYVSCCHDSANTSPIQSYGLHSGPVMS